MLWYKLLESPQIPLKKSSDSAQGSFQNSDIDANVHLGCPSDCTGIKIGLIFR